MRSPHVTRSGCRRDLVRRETLPPPCRESRHRSCRCHCPLQQGLQSAIPQLAEVAALSSAFGRRLMLGSAQTISRGTVWQNNGLVMIPINKFANLFCLVPFVAPHASYLFGLRASGTIDNAVLLHGTTQTSKEFLAPASPLNFMARASLLTPRDFL
jgi:hypothetical protein